MFHILLLVIYNSYILPNGVVEDTHFLRHLFSATLLEALGIKDDSGVIYDLINYRYFEDSVLGHWDLMIDGMVNVGIFLCCKPLIITSFISLLGLSSSKLQHTSS